MAELAEDAELTGLQEWLGRAWRRRRGLLDDPEAVAWAETWVTGGPELSPAARVEIYREQFWLRHTASLVDDFPGVGRILGQERWQRLVEEYLEVHVPDSWTLRDLGHALASFAAERPWLDERELVADMARLEWAFVEAFDAADAPALDTDAIGRLEPEDWEAGRLVLAPSVRLLRVGAPVHELRRSILAEEREISLPSPRPCCLVVARSPALRLRAEAISEPELRVLRAQAEGEPLLASFGAEIQAGTLGTEQPEGTLATWLGRWAGYGWVVGVARAPS